MLGVLIRIARTGLGKGVFEGSRGWLIAGIGAGALALAQRIVASQPEVVYRTELRPGELLEIKTLPPGS